MWRIFISSKDISQGKIIISDFARIHHIRDVLRLKSGDEIAACDEKENTYNCVIEGLTFNKLVLKIKQTKEPAAKEKTKITIACAIPKKAKFDDIIDKLAQLGVDRIIPLKTERVIVRLDSRKQADRLIRWKKICLSAAEQSQRVDLPIIDKFKDMKEVLADSDGYDLKLIPTLLGQRRALKDVLTVCQNIIVLIGPEGDFTQSEVNSAKKAGFIPVTLGNQVLRVETAAICVASFLRFSL